MLYLTGLSAFIWVILFFFRGWFWRVAFLPATTPENHSSFPTVAVVVPARDEAESIATTIQSLLKQDYQGRVHIVLVDDHSSDNTGLLAKRAAEQVGGLDRLTILQGEALPAGWTGKMWAVCQGIAKARSLNPDYILLTDADITHAPDNIRELVACAQANDLDLTSLMVRLNCETFVERALIPAFVYYFFMLYPQRWIASDKSPVAGAAGGCMLVRPEALDRIGGFEAIRDALIDDCSLAAAIKKSGGKICLGVTQTTVSSRRYISATEIWNMIARTAFTQLRYSVWLLLFTLVALAIIFVVPPLVGVWGRGPEQILALVAWGAMAVSFLPTLRLYRRSWVWGLVLPLVTIFYASATIGSAVRYWCGKGGQWKGRVQAG